MKDTKALRLFFIITILVSIVWETAYIVNPQDVFILLLMWTPGAAGIIASKIYYKGENALGIRFCKLRYILAGILIPIFYLTVSYVGAWCILKDSTIGIESLATQFGYSLIDDPVPAVVYIAIASVIGLLSSCLSAVGEELGWRGFMYPVMERVMGRKRALLLGGLTWAVWHMPIMIAGLYQANTQLMYGLLMFTVQIILMSIIMSWLRIRTNSLLPALLIHASHNLFDQMIFQPMSTERYVPYLAGEQGILTILVIFVITGSVVWTWKQGKDEGKNVSSKTKGKSL